MPSEKFRAYLVDDEPLAIERLGRMLRGRADVELIGSATDPAAALRELGSSSPDLLFLDIQMPGMNGFELLAAMPEPPLVIFTTAHDEYALRGFQANAIDYLLKPIEPEQLDRALAKLHRLRGGRPEWMKGLDVQAVLARLSEALGGEQPRYPTRIASRLGDRITVIDLAEVSHFLARDKLTYAAARGREHVVDDTIAQLERKLDPATFLRIHRGVLLNLNWLKAVNSSMTGRVLAILKDPKGTELPVSRDRVKALKERIGV
jgi:two-component system, LytTR family, response regulator